MDGHSYKTAAAELNSSINTVAFHVRNIYRKLQVHSNRKVVKVRRPDLSPLGRPLNARGRGRGELPLPALASGGEGGRGVKGGVAKRPRA